MLTHTGGIQAFAHIFIHMRAVQILMDEKELERTIGKPGDGGTDRSKLMREAMRRYLLELVRDADEQQYLASYRAHPTETAELGSWEKIQTWPED